MNLINSAYKLVQLFVSSLLFSAVVRVVVINFEVLCLPNLIFLNGSFHRLS